MYFLSVPCELRDLANEVEVVGFVSGFSIDMGQANVVPERNGLLIFAVLRVDSVIKSVFLSFFVEIDVLIGSKRIRSARRSDLLAVVKWY